MKTGEVGEGGGEMEILYIYLKWEQGCAGGWVNSAQ